MCRTGKVCVCASVRSLCGRRPADVCSAVSLTSYTSLQPESVTHHGEHTPPRAHAESVSPTNKHAAPLLPSESVSQTRPTTPALREAGCGQHEKEERTSGVLQAFCKPDHACLCLCYMKQPGVVLSLHRGGGGDERKREEKERRVGEEGRRGG